MDTVVFKKDAREKLKGNYIEIVSAMILIYAIVIMIITISNILEDTWLTYIITLLLSGFLALGLVTMVSKISRGEETNLDDLFSKINMFFKVVGLTMICLFVVGIFAIFLGVALYGLYVSSGLWGICNDWTVTGLMCLGIILSVALLVFTAYVTLSLSQVFFILNDNPKMNVTAIIRKSYNIMDGHKLEFFILLISFTGWILLGILTLGILYLWLFPYMLVTMANFYNELVPKRRKKNLKEKQK